MRQRSKGFTLIEVIVILAVIAILAAMAIPTALRIFQTTAENTTNDEMTNLKKAILGDITKLQNGVRTDFGYLGDVGCLPTSLQDLITKPAGMNSYSFNTTVQIGAGWNGPYITGSATGQATAEFTKDQWGADYHYTSTACTAPFTSTFYSNGPNTVDDSNSGDDINYSLAAADTTSTISGYVKDPNGNPVGSSTVTMNYPSNGAPATLNQTTNASGFYQFSNNIPLGKRSINVTPKLIVTSARATITAPTNATVCGGGVSRVSQCHYLEFTIVNYTAAAVTVTNVTATYASTPASFYYRISWGAPTNRVLDCDSNCTVPAGGTPVPGTGTTKTITSSSVALSSALKPYVFTVDSSQEQLSDIKIGAAGEVGSSVIVRLVNFRDSNTRSDNGNRVSVNGVPFTITFSDGSVVQFTPTAVPE
jgi:prepilin-type N-terminal cleavage/methylation domain-containing protein